MKEVDSIFTRFLINSIGNTESDDSNEVLDMEKQLNIKFPLSLKKILNIIVKGANINFLEWSLPDPGELFLSRKLDMGKNLFEQLIIRDQKNNSSSSMIEVFTNSVLLGYMSNKDRYYANVNVSRNDKVEVVYLNNKTGNYEFLFSDSIESFVCANFLLDKTRYKKDDKTIPIEYFKEQIINIKSKVNFPEQFNEIIELTGIKPTYRSYFPEAVYLFWRSLWIVYLLKCSDVKKVAKIGNIFNVIERKSINKTEDQIKSVNYKTPVFKALYWLWYFFFFNKKTALEEYIEAVKVIPSPLLKDTVILINDLVSGKEELGNIKSINRVKEEFLKLGLDPDNNDIKKTNTIYKNIDFSTNELNKSINNSSVNKNNDVEKKLSDETKMIKRKKRNLSEIEKAKILLKYIDRGSINNVIWDYIDNNEIVKSIFGYLSETDKELEFDYFRYEYIKELDLQKNKRKYSVEKNEIYETMHENRTKLAPLLYSDGKYEFGENYIKNKVLWFILNNEIKDLLKFIKKIGYENYPDISNDDFENELLLILNDFNKDDIFINKDILEETKKIIKLLVKIKSKKLLNFLEDLKKYFESKCEEEITNLDLYKKRFYNDISPLMINLYENLNYRDGIIFMKKWIDTPISNRIILALINIGDKDIINELEVICERQFGVFEKRIIKKFLLEYAKFINKLDVDLNIVKKLLEVLFQNEDDINLFYLKAFEIITTKMPENEIKDYLSVFNDFEIKGVRVYVNKFLKENNLDYKLLYLDMPFVKEIYNNEGKNKLLDLLKDDRVIFKHNIIKKLAKEKENIETYEEYILKYLNNYTRFQSCSFGIKRFEFPVFDDLIILCAQFKNKMIDDFIIGLKEHKNVVLNNCKLFNTTPKSGEWSKYLIDNLKYKYIEKNEGYSDAAIYKDVGSKLWMFGTMIYALAVNSFKDECVAVGVNKIITFSLDGEIKKVIDIVDCGMDVDISKSGEEFAVGFESGNASIYNSFSGDFKFNIIEKNNSTGKVNRLCYSKDGNKIAVITNSGILYIWDVKTNRLLKDINFEEELNSVDWLDDSNRIVLGFEKRIIIYNIKDEKVVVEKNLYVREIRVSKRNDNGKILIAVGGENIILFSEELKEVKKLEQKGVTRLRFNRSGDILYASSGIYEHKGLSCWELGEYNQIKLRDNDFAINGLDVNQDLGIVYAVGDRNGVYYWSKDNQKIEIESIGHDDFVSDIGFSKKYSSVISTSYDGKAIMWFPNNSGLVLYSNEEKYKIESIAISNDERYIVYGMDNLIVKSDTITGKNTKIKTNGICKKMLSLNNNIILATVKSMIYFIGTENTIDFKKIIKNICILSEYEKIVLTSENEQSIYIYNMENYTMERKIDLPLDDFIINDFSLSTDQKEMYILCSDDTIRVYNTSNWNLEKEIFMDISGSEIIVIDNNKKIVLVNKNRLYIIETEKFVICVDVELDSDITAAKLFDEKTLVIGLNNGFVTKVLI